jgi:predicted DNA-binding transcriptional regulator AlpA
MTVETLPTSVRIANHLGLLTAKELAIIIGGVSRSTIFRWASKGILPCVRIGGMVRFDPGKTAAWYSKQERRA